MAQRWTETSSQIAKITAKSNGMGRNFVKSKTPLFCFTDIMDGPYYVNILQTQLLPAAQSLYGRSWRLQQDNDPKHTSRVAKDFIAENKINTIDWPSNSPDLNPIENIWYIMKNNVEKRMPRNVDELKQFMVEEWEKIPQETVKNIIMSMKRRCELVLEKNGDRISY